MKNHTDVVTSVRFNQGNGVFIVSVGSDCKLIVSIEYHDIDLGLRWKETERTY